MANYDDYNSHTKNARSKRTEEQLQQAAQVKARVMRYYDQKEKFEKTKTVVARFISMN